MPRRIRRERLKREETDKAYVKLLTGADPAAHAGELARLRASSGAQPTRRSGRTFAATSESEQAQARDRAAAVGASRPTPGRTLADLLPDLRTPRQPSAAVRPTPSVAAGHTPWFVDDAAAAGLRFVHENGTETARLIPPSSASGGVGLLDYDGDGWLDVYVVQGGPFPSGPATPHDGDRLFRNQANGSFVDVTEQAGIAAAVRGYGHGVAVADFDNDGRPDLFLTRWHCYVLLRNQGNGRFEDVTEQAGLGGDRDWPTSAAFADLDNDGDLDLYVCHYLSWNVNDHPVCVDPKNPSRYNCNPRDFAALPDHVFRNDAGRFVDVTALAGVVDHRRAGIGRGRGRPRRRPPDRPLRGKRHDGQLSLAQPGRLPLRRAGHWKPARPAPAAAISRPAWAWRAATSTATDVLDLAVTNFYNESTSFFRNLGGGFFGDRGEAIGLSAPSRYLLGWGIAFPDVNNDGRLDLLTANGHIYRRPAPDPLHHAGAAPGRGRRRQADRRHHARPVLLSSSLHLGRGLAEGDLDNDGRVDALIVAQNEPLIYLHNLTRAGHFVTLRLEGTTSNRDAIGAKVTLTAGGRRQVAQRTGGGSFQSASDPRLHFGLADATRVETIEILWPSGRVDRYHDLAADTAYHLREGNPTAMPLKGWRP